MNTYIPEYSVLGWVVILACGALVVWRAYKLWAHRRWLKRHRYIGFGWVLHWDEVSGEAIVLSRLLDSPAGWSGVEIGDRLLSSRDKLFTTGLSEDEFRSHFVDNPVHEGDVQTFTLARKDTEEPYLVTMVATKIQGPIPVYGAPPEYIRHDYRYKVGLCVCIKTGQLVESVSLSDEYIEELLN